MWNDPDGLVRFFVKKFILKSVMDKAHSSISLTKIDLNDVTKQKPSCLVDLGFAVICEIKLLSKKKMTNNQLVRFKKKVVEANICTRLIEKMFIIVLFCQMSQISITSIYCRVSRHF